MTNSKIVVPSSKNSLGRGKKNEKEEKEEKNEILSNPFRFTNLLTSSNPAK